MNRRLQLVGDDAGSFIGEAEAESTHGDGSGVDHGSGSVRGVERVDSPRGVAQQRGDIYNVASRRYIEAATWLALAAEELQEALDGDEPLIILERLLTEYNRRVDEIKHANRDRIDVAEEDRVIEITRDCCMKVRQGNRARNAAIVKLSAAGNRAIQSTGSRHGTPFSGFPPEDTIEQHVLPVGGEAATGDPGVTTTVRGEGNEASRIAHVKLPKFELSDYYGDPTFYNAFAEEFTNRVHNVALFTNLDKMQLLVLHCKGDAKQIMDQYQVTGENYAAAWSALKDRCGQPEIIRVHVLDKLENLEAPSGSGEAYIKSLFKFHDQIKALVHTLSQVGLEGEVSDSIFCHNVLKKFPWTIRNKWATNPATRGRENELKYALQFLEQEANGMRLSGTYGTPKRREKADKSGETSQSGTAVALLTPQNFVETAANQGGGHTKKCPFCSSKTHKPAHCPRFWQSLVERRIAMAREAKLCARCLRSADRGHQCTEEVCCHCGGLHHGKLCRTNEVNKANRRMGQAQARAPAGPRQAVPQQQPWRAQQPGPQPQQYWQLQQQPWPLQLQHQPPQPWSQQSPRHSQPGVTGQPQANRPVSQLQTGNPVQAPPVGYGQGGYIPVSELPNGQGRFNNVSGPSHYAGPALTAVGSRQRVTTLQTAKIDVRMADGSLYKASVVFDTGAERSYMSSSLRRKIRPRLINRDWVSYGAFGGENASPASLSSVYQVEFRDLDGQFHKLELAEIPVICPPLERTPIPDQVMEQFRGLVLADEYGVHATYQVDVLIGQDYYWSLVDYLQGRRYGALVALPTPFGYLVSGTWGAGRLEQRTSATLLAPRSASPKEISMFWDLEMLGISADEAAKDHLENHPVLAQFHKGLSYNPTLRRYQVSALYKNDEDRLFMKNNFRGANKRADSLRRKLVREGLWEEYQTTMGGYAAEGMIEGIPDAEIDADCCYYMPQQLVIKQDELGKMKLRPVFDASAKNPWGLSANDIMETGPALQPDIVAMTIKWRRWRVALSGDVEKAFLQIVLNPKDRDMFRFLLLREGGVKHCRFARVPFGGTSSPFLLNAVLRHHLSLFPGNPVAEELKECIYVDNVLTGADTEEEAEVKFQEATNILGKAGLHLKKWDSNSNRVINLLQASDVYQPESKVLGISWKANEDIFTYTDIKETGSPTLTKRSLLSIFSRIYDPLGIVGPFVLVAKILFQKAWQQTIGWDEPLPKELSEPFQEWIIGTRELKNINLPRVYFPGVMWTEVKEGLELHAFGDASQVGYGAVVYGRIRTAEGYQVSIVAARCRVAPLKVISLPRLELLAALCCARLVKYIEKALEIKATVRCYTDSSCTLAWINGEASKYKTFVANRVAEIHTLVGKEQWQHCPGSLNPADMASRGLSGAEMVSANTWFRGPDWLRTQEVCPSSADWMARVSAGELELKPAGALISPTTVSTLGPDLESFGTLSQTISFMGWMGRFIKYIKCKVTGQQCRTGPLQEDELKESQRLVFRWVQHKHYPIDAQSLAKGKALPRGSHLMMMNPFVDQDGLMRVTGRLQLSGLSYDQIHPIIIPKGGLAKLLFRETHLRMKHAGCDCVLTELRRKYHLISAKRIGKGVISTCVPCQRQDTRPCNQVAPPLPRDRVMRAAPFSRTGVDFAGPLTVKGSGEKHYVLLFTCSITRAVHLELTASMSIDQFVYSFRMFAARRGIPERIYSDNALTFIGAPERLAKLYGMQRPHWKYNAPLAPWQGGWWERLVGVAKSALKKSLGNSTVTKEELAAVLVEVEQVINSRPLTRLSEDPQAEGPLTPNHFLHALGGASNLSGEDGMGQTPIMLRQLHTLRLQNLEKFWTRFKEEYLTSLPAVVKHHKAGRNLRIGDLVMLRGERFTPRLQWPMATVVQVHPGSDGFVRNVTVKTAKGTFRRAVQRLHHLELDSAEGESAEPKCSKDELGNNPGTKEKLAPVLTEGDDSDAGEAAHFTRSGRKVRRTVKLNL